MSFIHDGNHTDMPSFADVFQLTMQAELGISSLELRFRTKLLQQAVVEPAWRELRVGQVEHKVFILRQVCFKPAKDGALPNTYISSKHTEQLMLGYITESAYNLLEVV